MLNALSTGIFFGAFQLSQKITSPKTPQMISSEEVEALKFLIRLQAAYNFQVSTKKEQRPRRKLPPVPKFEESEQEPEIQKKVQLSAAGQSQPWHQDTMIKIEDDVGDQSGSPVQSPSHHHHPHHHHHHHLEEEKSQSEEKQVILSQMNAMISKQAAEEAADTSDSDSSSTNESMDKKDLKKYRKLESCMIEVVKKLEIEDEDVVEYGREFLKDVVPHLIEHFNKKPFTSIAGAVLIFACYKAGYPMTTKRIMEASDSKESIIMKCYCSIKDILIQKKYRK